MENRVSDASMDELNLKQRALLVEMVRAICDTPDCLRISPREILVEIIKNYPDI